MASLLLQIDYESGLEGMRETFSEWDESVWQARRERESRNNDGPAAPDSGAAEGRISMKDGAAPDTRKRAIQWIEEGIKWMEEGRSLLGLLQGLVDEGEQVSASATAVEQDSKPLRQENGELQREPEEIVEVVPVGELDMASASQMKLQDHLDAGRTRLVLDLGDVSYIDSGALGEVVRAMKRAREVGGDLRLCGLRGDVLRIFEITGLGKAIAVYATREEAVASWLSQ
jgi:anti-sigma B factor antagonist